MHQRQQGEGLGRAAHRMLGENESQTLCLVAELPSDGRLCVGGEVPLGEHEVEDRLHGGQAQSELLTGEVIVEKRELAKPTPSTPESLVYVGFGGEEPLRDLANVETAECLQRDHQL